MTVSTPSSAFKFVSTGRWCPSDYRPGGIDEGGELLECFSGPVRRSQEPKFGEEAL
jgi:hypothetical protein